MYKSALLILTLCLGGLLSIRGLERSQHTPPLVRPRGRVNVPAGLAAPFGLTGQSDLVIKTGLATQTRISRPSAAAMPYFVFPVVDNSTISSYFDHQAAAGLITFYDGRHSSSGAGFYFSCSVPAMYDWVGCEDPVSGAGACSDSRELWYDGHKGIDFEYSPNWNTGAACDPARFNGITQEVYAPARGKVLMAGTDPNRPANGWHIRLMHDLNGNGNFNDDNFRSVYLHFTANALAVVPGQIVEVGQYLGLGGSTGYSSSPHLHFEVQRSRDFFQTTYWSVDPFGWQGPGGDPWPYTNEILWQALPPPPNLTKILHLPLISNTYPQCPGCGQLLQNGDFEAGQTAWSEQGGQLIRLNGDPELTAAPYSGNYLAWLGGQANAVTVLNQNIAIPGGVTGGTLRYMLQVQTTESGGAQDYFYVRLRMLDGTVLQDIEVLDNAFTTQNQWVQREIPLIDLTPYQGQTLYLNIKATNSSANPTSFYIDDMILLGTSP